MPLDDHQRLTLQTNLARDRAEQLLAGLKKALAETRAEIEAGKRPELTAEQIAEGERALLNAIAAAERMVANVNEALRIAEAGFKDDEA